jgi:hypothetical protein
MSEIGHNYGAGADALRTDLEEFSEACVRWLGKALDAESAPVVVDVIARGRKLRDKLEAARKAEKQPSLDEGRAIDAAYKKPLDEVKGLLDGLAKGMTAYEVAEAKRRREEAEAAARAAAEAEAAAKAAAEADDPFAAYDAQTQASNDRAIAVAKDRAAADRPRVASAEGVTRAMSLRTFWRCEVVNARALVEHFAEYEPVVNAALALADRVAREQQGDVEIPGCRIVSEQRAVA